MSTTNYSTIAISSGDELDVRSFGIKQGMSRLFHVDVRAVSRSHDIDFDEVIGAPAKFSLQTGSGSHSWQGVCAQIEQTRVERRGLATYSLVIMPRAWLMTKRKNYRIFQFESELDIVKKMLGEWSVPFEERVDKSGHKARKYRCQYAETDFDFMSRMLEDAGISYYFEEKGGQSVMVLDDAPQARALGKPRLRFHDAPDSADVDFVTRVAVGQRVGLGKMTIGDLDYRRPSTNQPRLSATGGLPTEQALEEFHYEPGAFLYKQSGAGGKTPAADDRGASRTDEQAGAAKVESRLNGGRAGTKRVTFESNAIDLVPGVIMSVIDHPHRVLGADRSLLVTEALLEGDHDEDWRVHVEVVPTDAPHKPELRTPRPKVTGLESATIVGPQGEEIHTDEYGRVRVQFHWDREGRRDETSSCWIPSSQPWAGAGFGGINLPRVGQEVLVEFLGGNPDRPVVVGRVFTETQPPPYKLPDYKRVSGLRSETSPRVITGGAGADGDVAQFAKGLLGGLASSIVPGGIAEALENPLFQAKSPDQQTHSWKGNEISVHDQPNKQQLYLQAERNMNTVVKKNQTTVIGDSRSTAVTYDDVLLVGRDQSQVIGNKQSTTVKADRSVKVKGAQKHEVVGDISVHTEANQSYHVEQTFHSHAKDHLITSRPVGSIILLVGKSSIIMQPDFIVINSVDVFINPGPEDTRKAMQGIRPEKPEEKEAREKKEAEKQRAADAFQMANTSIRQGDHLLYYQYFAPTQVRPAAVTKEQIAAFHKSKWQEYFNPGGSPGDDQLYNDLLSNASKKPWEIEWEFAKPPAGTP
ncbi:MAG: type VI secretion system tip protein VgrG [Polyangiaceae bacterium]|nr:type VI secretion system tip protein VgrG [Polyangiaceae bacterium]